MSSSSSLGSAPVPAPAPPKIWKVGTLTYTSGGLVALFLWLLLGDFSWSMRDRSVGPMAQWYLDHLGVPSLWFGLLVSSFPAAVVLVLGPIISVKSDQHRGRWGRRIPFLLVTTPIAAFGMIGLALTPFLSKWMHGHFPEQSEMLVSLVCFGVFWAAFEFATVAGQAVFGGLINDVVPKPLLGRFYGLFRAVNLIDAIIFNYWIMGKVPQHFTLILIVIGVFYVTSFTWVCLRVKEGSYPPPARPDVAASSAIGGFLAGARSYFRECFTNRYYLAVFIMLTCAALAFAPVNIFSLPYARSLGVDMDTYGEALALTFLISLGLSYFLGWLADAFHPLRVSIVTLIGYVGVTAWGGLFADTPATFLTSWVLHGVLSGCYFTSAASLGQRLFPHEKFAQFASAAGMVLAPPNIVLAPLVGLVIDGDNGSYRYTFGAGCILAVMALITAWIVHVRFMKLGGPKDYQAPEVTG